MSRVRKVVISVLAIILVISLFGLSFGTSFDLAFHSPNHLKTWATASDFYDSVVAKASSDTASNISNPKLLSGLDPIIKQSVVKVFPKSQLNQYIDTIINSNYAWLKGKTSTPNFTINVSSQKAAFANSIGNYVANQYQGLPKCSLSQIVSQITANPFNLACRTSVLSSAQIKDNVVKDIESAKILVSSNVITASSVKRNGKPYFLAFNAQKAYKHLQYAPIVTAVIGIICVSGIIFLVNRKRLALLIAGVCFGFTGLILLITSVSTGRIDSRISSNLSKHSNLSSFTNPVDSLIHKVISFVNGVNLWFSLGYLLIALTLLYLLFMKRRRAPMQNRVGDKSTDTTPTTNEPAENIAAQHEPTNHHAKIQPTAPVLKSNKNNKRSVQ
jgi:hypothetical protein